MEYNFNTLIIGAGVAGMTSAIYLKRADVNVAILEKSAPGGQMNMTAKIENYPGFNSIPGPDLSMKIFEQINSLEIPYVYGNVLDIIKLESGYNVVTDQETLFVKKVIIASGRSPRKLEIPNERELLGKGISTCAICDGAFYKGQDVVVIGGGNSAVEEAIYLSKIARTVTIVHRRDTFRANEASIKELKSIDNIIFKYKFLTTEFISEDGNLVGIKIKNVETEEEEIVNITGAFVFIGHVPNTDFVKTLDILDESGYVITDNHMRTPMNYIYAAGDVIRKDLYQIVTAAGDAAISSISAIADK